ncbi:MAG TPA: glutamate--cysteine ligase [bacterium]|nr:glutamate--cysteine ligase [bacterium]
MINRLKEQLEQNRAAVEAWFTKKAGECGEPFYASVDLRNSHHKIAVVDTNAFPAGFNNLCPHYCEQVSELFRSRIERHYPGARRILLFPEAHTRNKYYLENVRRILAALSHAGFEARAGTSDPELRTDSITLAAQEGEVELWRLTRDGAGLEASGFRPDLVISNNDFAAGVPEILAGLSIPIVPPVGLGWHRRRKYDHFRILNELVAEFAPVAGMDPWILSALIGKVSPVDFTDDASRERLARAVDELIGRVRAEYEARGIADEPFVFIKHNAGTYGMAIMTARSGDEVRKASRKTRVKMQTGKGRALVNEVILQEGIPTRDSMEGHPMEPVICLVGFTPVGGFFRLHRQRSATENLNVVGMEFKRLCFHQVAGQHPEHLDDGCEQAEELLYAYGALARLAALALGAEMKKLGEDP